MSEANREPPREISPGAVRGCRNVAIGVGALFGIAIGAFVVLLFIAEPADSPSSGVFFRDCSPAQEEHLASVHAALVDNNRMLGQYDDFTAVSGGSEHRLKMEMQKPWPMRLTCVTSADCSHGIVPPGSIGVSAIQLEVCANNTPEADFCASFATLAYGQALARRVVPERAERYHDFILARCGDIY